MLTKAVANITAKYNCNTAGGTNITTNITTNSNNNNDNNNTGGGAIE